MNPEIFNKIEKIRGRAKSITGKKDMEEILSRIDYLEKESSAPNFWNSNEEAQKKMQELGDLKNEIGDINLLTNSLEDIDTLIELENEGESIENDIGREIKKIEELLLKLEIETFLSGKFDKSSAVFSIHAGQGGTEACDWTEMLMRMYTRYFEMKGWRVTTLDLISGEEAGIKSVTMEVVGKFVYGYLKKEHGTHRLVRVSPFNSQGLRQTSFAGVEVEPLVEDDIEIEINDEDIEFSAVRAGGPGGQSVNKTSSAVRIIHKPTGISVSSSALKSQLQNRKAAMNLLKSKLLKIEEERHEKEMTEEKGEHKIAAWGNQIRNYILQPYKLIKDLRTGIETDQVEKVLDGELEKFIQAEIRI
ncbi:MAG TPA: peptide chain release factor 2 [Candidatus Dojkabacteria bacterium]|jgi:peptide chain release factor 2